MINKNLFVIAAIGLAAFECAKKPSSPNNPTVSETSTDSRAVIEAKIDEQLIDQHRSLVKLDKVQANETVLAYRDANGRRREKLEVSYQKSVKSLGDLRQATANAWADAHSKTEGLVATSRTQIEDAWARQTFVDDLSAQKGKVKVAIEKLQKSADAATGAAKQSIEDQRVALENKGKELDDRFDRLQASSEGNWADFKADVSKIWGDIKTGFKDLF